MQAGWKNSVCTAMCACLHFFSNYQPKFALLCLKMYLYRMQTSIPQQFSNLYQNEDLEHMKLTSIQCEPGNNNTAQRQEKAPMLFSRPCAFYLMLKFTLRGQKTFLVAKGSASKNPQVNFQGLTWAQINGKIIFHNYTMIYLIFI